MRNEESDEFYFRILDSVCIGLFVTEYSYLLVLGVLARN